MESELAVDDAFPFKFVDKSFDELVKDVELEKHLAISKDLGDLISRINKLLNGVGIDRFAHTNLTSLNSVLEPIGNFDPKVTDRYAWEGFHCDDFMARHLQLKKKPIFRSVIQEYIDNAPFDHDLLRRNRDISKFLTEVGMQDCYNIPMFDEGRYGLFSISIHHGTPEKFREITLKNIKFIHQLAEVVDRIGRNKFASQFIPNKLTRISLSPRPVEILDLMANKDLNAAETARLLGLHEVTINKHIAAAKKALKANTLPGLLMAAIKAGLISIHLG